MDATSAPGASFAAALEGCIRQTAAIVSFTLPTWAEHCESPQTKARYQARILQHSLHSMRLEHGYAAAQWCAFYSQALPMGRMEGDLDELFLCPASRICEPDRMLAHPRRWEEQWPTCGCGVNKPLRSAANEAQGVPANVLLYGCTRPYTPWHAVSASTCARG